MIHFNPLVFDFEYSFERVIPRERLGLFSRLLTAAFGGNFEALSDTTMCPQPKDAKDLQTHRLIWPVRNHITVSNRKSIVDLVHFVDLSALSTKQAYQVIAEAVLPEFTDETSLIGGVYPRVVILVDTLFDSDSYDNLLSKLLFDGVVSVLSIDEKSVKILHKSSQVCSISPELEIAPRKNIEELASYIETHLIRRIGHFSRSFKENDLGCQLFFYDGTFCLEEVAELLQSEIEQRLTTYGGEFCVIYHCPTSPWLQSACIKAANKLENGEHAGRYRGVSDIYDLDKPSDKKLKFFFIVDLFDSGRTVKSEFRDRILARFPESETEVISIMCTKVKDQQAVLEINGVRLPVKSFIRVRQEFFQKPECDVCRFELDGRSRLSDVQEGMFSTFVFWKMATEAGFGREIVNSTSLRPTEDNLPDMLQLVKLNGPFLVERIRNALNSKYPGFQNLGKSVLIYPDETFGTPFSQEFEKNNHRQPTLDDTPSGLLAGLLKRLLRFETLGIPRSVINNGNFLRLGELDPKLERQIEQLPELIVVLDEFLREGRTLNAILDLLGSYNKPARVVFPMFDFSSLDWPGEHTKKFPEVETMTFYRIQL